MYYFTIFKIPLNGPIKEEMTEVGRLLRPSELNGRSAVDQSQNWLDTT